MLMRTGSKGNRCTLFVWMYSGEATLEKQDEGSSKKLNIELSYNPRIPPLGAYLEETKSVPQNKQNQYICTPVLIAALLTTLLTSK